MESWVQSWRPRTNAFFAIFPLHLSKVLRLPRKSDARSYVLHLSRKIISANLKIWCSKMQPLSGNQRPDLLTALMNMSLVLCLPREMHLCRSSSNVPRLPSFLEMLQNPHVLLTFDNAHNPLRLPRKNDIWTSKSAPNPSVFCTFDFEMCFAPQRRALFRHLNFQKWSGNGVLCTFWLRNASRHNGVHFFDISIQKWSGNGVLCTFWLRNVLRATTACTLSTSQLPKVVRPWGVLCILTSKCASRHNGVQFFISHLASWLCTGRFSEPAFRPSGATNHRKNTVFRDFPTFSRTWIFFLLRLSLSSSLLFSSLLFSDSSHLCFSSVHTLTSKLPSIINGLYKWMFIVGLTTLIRQFL